MSTTEHTSRIEVDALERRGSVGRRSQRPAGPAQHLAQERERLAGLQWKRFGVEMQGSTIGAVLNGIDLAQVAGDAEAIAEIRAALLEYKVIFFRDQQLNTEQHVAFAAAFGELEEHPFLQASDDDPRLVRFEKSEAAGGYENIWHSDVSWREIPSMGSILRAIEVPAIGGDTLFCDMYAAWEGLDDDTRGQLASLQATHDALRAFGAGLSEAESEEQRAKFPTQTHPLMRTHPETERQLLYVNRVFTDSIVGIEPDASESLLSFLCSQADVPEYQCRFHWEPGSIAFWDNRAVQHYASSDYWPQRRVMERATVIGTRPR